MVAEVFAGIGAFKTMFDMAKALKDINDATIRNGAVIELQEQILSAQAAQSELVERVRSLETKVAGFETWDAERQRYELKPLGQEGTFAYALKEGAAGGEPAHCICPDCYQQRQKSILQHVTRYPGRTDVRLCQRCGWEAYVSGGWEAAHGAGSASRRKR